MRLIIKKENFISEIFDKYHVELFNFVLSRVGYKKAVAEDVTQEIFYKLWKSRESFDQNKSSVRTWIYVIARNHIIDHYRTKKDDMKVEVDPKGLSAVAVELNVEDAALFASVVEAMCKLSSQDQELIQFRYVQGLQIKEIAEILNKTESAVKVAIHRAIKKLRKLFDVE